VAEGKAEMGVLVCGTGIGVSIAANKIKGIRAANVTNVEMARLAREHNDANMVAVGARITPVALAIEIVRTFLKSEFSGGRHTKRVEKIQDLEQQ
jgi:ribose 5-phosphate isomerase B